MDDAATFVADFPDTTFVLVHAGMLVDREPSTVDEWTRGMRRLAERPNVVVKLTGQGTFVHRVDRSLIDLVAATSLELFGPRRCMWGSNFPIEKLWTDLKTLVSAWEQTMSRYPAETRREVFAETAKRVYRIR
jgi:predicted TIM-barrel fold metal-dependent hydrolase